jgi:hypothetical protein
MKNATTDLPESDPSIKRATNRRMLGAALAFLSAGVAGDVNAAMAQTHSSPTMTTIDAFTDAAKLAEYCVLNQPRMSLAEQKRAKERFAQLIPAKKAELELLLKGKTQAEMSALFALPGYEWIKTEPFKQHAKDLYNAAAPKDAIGQTGASSPEGKTEDPKENAKTEDPKENADNNKNNDPQQPPKITVLSRNDPRNLAGKVKVKK